MRSLIAILIASIFIFQSAGKLIIIGNYSINKEYIAKNLCENKAKPVLKCKGKCHLKKELEKEDKKENVPSNNIKEKYEVQFFSDLQKVIVSKKITETNNLNTTYLFSDYSNHLKSIFQPPRA